MVALPGEATCRERLEILGGGGSIGTIICHRDDIFPNSFCFTRMLKRLKNVRALRPSGCSEKRLA